MYIKKDIYIHNFIEIKKIKKFTLKIMYLNSLMSQIYIFISHLKKYILPQK